MKKITFILGIVLIIESEALSCSCIDPGSPRDSFHQATAVFTGKVIAKGDDGIEIRYDYGIFNSSPTFIVYIFEVTKSFKGVENQTIVVATGVSGGDCGYNFVVGKEYIVYANNRKNKRIDLTTSICSRTREIKDAQEDLLFLKTINNNN